MTYSGMLMLVAGAAAARLIYRREEPRCGPRW